MKVLAVIPTLAQDVVRLNKSIESLRSHSGQNLFEILVVNNSGNETIAGLAPVDYVLSPGVNLGYVGALEIARRNFRSDFLWSIQDDMTLRNCVLDLLVAEMEKEPQLAVCSPVLIRDGLVPARSRAGVFTNPDQTRWENYPISDVSPLDLPSDVDYSFVSGSGALFRSTALDAVGGFNLDLYPLMHVDVDVCARFLSHGWRISLLDKAHINHEVQGSTPGLLGQVLDRANRALVEQALEGKLRHEDHSFVPVDADIMLAVARRASFLFIDVAREATIRLEDARSQISALISEKHQTDSRLREVQSQLEGVGIHLDAIQRSTSWRISAPIRAVGRLLRRLCIPEGLTKRKVRVAQKGNMSWT